MSNIAVLTNGPRAYAGARLRGFWLADVDPVHFKVFAPGDELALDDCGTVVFQKRQGDTDFERAHRYKAEGRKVVYDLCDPVWLHDDPRHFYKMLAVADAVTVSSQALADAIADHPDIADGKVEKRIVVIPDRMLASAHPTTAEHIERDRPIRLVWFGAGQNRIALITALPLLSYMSYSVPLELVVIDDLPQVKIEAGSPERAKVTHIAWTLETFHAQLVACDIAVLPPHPGPLGDYKSNNKAVTAWWAGLPTTSGYDLGELQQLATDADLRARMGKANRSIAERDYDITQSAAQWRALAAELHGETVRVSPNGTKPEFIKTVGQMIMDDKVNPDAPMIKVIQVATRERGNE